MSNRNWDDNSIQFPRLLAEIVATQDRLDLPALAESMDLTLEEVAELFERAEQAWQSVKDVTCPADRGVREAKARILREIEGDDSALDDLVHEIASLTASGINNAGPATQLDFLMREGLELSHIANCIGVDIDEEDQ